MLRVQVLLKELVKEELLKNIEELKVDYPYQISDQESLDTMFKLVENEGLLGVSSGINVAGALRLAKDIGPGKILLRSFVILVQDT